MRVLLKHTFLTQCVYDECCFYGNDLIVLAYVDDLLLLGKTTSINSVMQTLKKKFKLTSTELDQEVDFLAFEIKRQENNDFTLSQKQYLQKMFCFFQGFDYFNQKGRLKGYTKLKVITYCISHVNYYYYFFLQLCSKHRSTYWYCL